MRVLQVHNKYQVFGGEDVVVQKEYLLLKENGIEVEQLFFDNGNIDMTKIFVNRVSGDILKKKINSFNPDVIHVHNVFYEASPSIFAVAKELGIPTVMTLHNYRLLCPNGLFLRNNKLCTKCQTLKFPVFALGHKCFKDSYLKSAALSSSLFYHNVKGTWSNQVDRFIVLTPFAKELFLNSSLKIETSKISVKANSTDDLLQALEPKSDRKGFLFVGRLSNEKGIDVLIDAFNQLKEFELTVVGEGDLLPALTARANNNIKFLGKQDFTTIVGLLKTTKALIFPSICYEGLPNTIIESFSAGTPILASNIDNVNSIVTENYNGMFFETGKVDSLCKVIRSFAKDTPSFFYENARKTYELNYSHERNLTSLLKIYKGVIDEKNKTLNEA